MANKPPPVIQKQCLTLSDERGAFPVPASVSNGRLREPFGVSSHRVWQLDSHSKGLTNVDIAFGARSVYI